MEYTKWKISIYLNKLVFARFQPNIFPHLVGEVFRLDRQWCCDRFELNLAIREKPASHRCPILLFFHYGLRHIVQLHPAASNLQKALEWEICRKKSSFSNYCGVIGCSQMKSKLVPMVTFFTRKNCSLCEEAKQAVMSVKSKVIILV